MTRLAVVGLLLTLSALAVTVAPLAAQGDPSPRTAMERIFALDSVDLQRTACYGTCPIYRVRVTRSLAVRFWRGDAATAVPRKDSLSFESFRAIPFALLAARFLDLPDDIEQSPMCGGAVTDHPHAIVTLYMPTGTKRVDDYLGCAWSPATLRNLANEIDSAAGVAKLLRIR